MSIHTLPIVAVRNTVLFPRMVMPISAGRARSVAAVEAALESDRTLVLLTQKDPATDDPAPEDLHSLGTRAHIDKITQTGNGYQLVLHGRERVQLLKLEGQDPYLRGRVQTLPQPEDDSPAVEALQRSVLELAARLLALVGQTPRVDASALVGQLSSQLSDPMALVYFVAGTMNLGTERDLKLLAANTRLEALELVHRYLVRELEVQEVQQTITSQVRSEMDKDQRKYLLRQQLRAIRQELGEEDTEQAELELLREKLEGADLPEAVRQEADRELKRLERLNAASPDHALTRTYLELLAELPWQVLTEDTHDLKRARQILDDDHFGLQDVKTRILEHLAVMQLNPTARAPIVLLVGPPGVGKTSLGQSIARALDRKFERMSLGGLHDEAELRGHRRTYVGALPGRLIQAVRRAGARNPVLMLDEVDKLGNSYRGDPASALLEIIDPAQNDKFRDNYLDLPFDLSRVFFILTANTTDSIPRPLLDRMEVIRLSGYSEEEKAEIARRYLWPRQLQETGIHDSRLNLTESGLNYLIARHTREAGVRELERVLGKVTRRLALQLAEGEPDERLNLDEERLSDLLGPERFQPESVRSELAVGVATGLAWTSVGGDVLYIETIRIPGGTGLTLTGQLGEVMQESARAAQSYILANPRRFKVGDRRRREGIHIHIPAGAIPKDGPSAGITLAVSLASAYSGRPVRSDLAMTGELTLTGLVLPVGGIREKVLAARRAGLHEVILPRENRSALKELPDNVRSDMRFHLVDHLDQVLELALPDLDAVRSLPKAG